MLCPFKREDLTYQARAAGKCNVATALVDNIQALSQWLCYRAG
eukprot:COSAG02_NODE_35195_length_472_cov_0.823056_1_plen_42_part_10